MLASDLFRLLDEGLGEDELRRRAAELLDPAGGTRSVLEAEAHVYRSLCEHLRHRTSVQNIDLMTLSGFCRNCLSKWLMRGAAMAGLAGVDDATARAAVYGMPYTAWKKQHQAASTPEQKAAYKASTHLHAVHEPVDLSDVCCQPTLDGAALPPTLRPSSGQRTCSPRARALPVAAAVQLSAPASVAAAPPLAVGEPSAPVGRASPYPMLPVDDAIELGLAAAERAIATNGRAPEVLALSAVGASRRAAVAVAAPIAIPPFRASIMDGYAVLASDGAATRRCVGRALAGHDPAFAIARGECSYITTGSKLPPGADAVVKVEDVVATGDAEVTHTIAPTRAVAAGANIRPEGCDIARGATLVAAHDAISPAVLGLLAATGLGTISAVRRPVVGVLSTGDELFDSSARGGALRGAKIFDANRAALVAALAAAGADTRDFGIVPDGGAALGAALDAATATCDVVVTSGGVSMGDADLVKVGVVVFLFVGLYSIVSRRIASTVRAATATLSHMPIALILTARSLQALLEERGTVHFGRILMKPGKPTTLAEVVTRDGSGGR